MVYIDDIIVFSKDFATHLLDVEEVLKRIGASGFKIKPTKCEWGKETVKYVGHIISKKGIEPDFDTIKHVKECKPPQTIQQIQEFLGLANYYRKFVRSFADVAAPLTQLLKKTEIFKWGAEQQKAFDTLKERLTTAPILIYPDFSKPMILMTDASNVAIGAVLGQIGPMARNTP